MPALRNTLASWTILAALVTMLAGLALPVEAPAQLLTDVARRLDADMTRHSAPATSPPEDRVGITGAAATTEPITEIHAGGCVDYETAQPELALIATDGSTAWVEQAGDLTIVAEASGRLRVMDLVNPHVPRVSFETDYPGITCLTVSDTLLFVGLTNGTWDGFDLYSLADPAQPRLLQSTGLDIRWYDYTVTLPAIDCQIVGDRMYILATAGSYKRGIFLLAGC